MSWVKNDDYNHPETTKSPVENEKKTRPQKGSDPMDLVTPTCPKTINGNELAEKMCELTNVFFYEHWQYSIGKHGACRNRKGTAWYE
jgi:hypothetical protein